MDGMNQARDGFDPYHQWLGIPPDEQPASYYRLLGIRELEDNVDVIVHAADRCMAHVRTFQSGVRSEWSQKLLNELAAARVCLLDPEQKLTYDTALVHRCRALGQALKCSRDRCAATAVEPPPYQDDPVVVASRKLYRTRGRTTGRSATGARRRKQRQIGRVAAVITLLVVLGTILAIGYHVLLTP